MIRSMTSEREAELSTWEARRASLAMCGMMICVLDDEFFSVFWNVDDVLADLWRFNGQRKRGVSDERTVVAQIERKSGINLIFGWKDDV